MKNKEVCFECGKPSITMYCAKCLPPKHARKKKFSSVSDMECGDGYKVLMAKGEIRRIVKKKIEDY